MAHPPEQLSTPRTFEQLVDHPLEVTERDLVGGDAAGTDRDQVLQPRGDRGGDHDGRVVVAGDGLASGEQREQLPGAVRRRRSEGRQLLTEHLELALGAGTDDRLGGFGPPAGEQLRRRHVGNAVTAFRVVGPR